MIEETVDSQRFYDEISIEDAINLFGELGFHYHNGEIGSAGENIFEVPVRQILPYLEGVTSLLDCGCGWGGPARMIMNELNIPVTGVTISKNQAQFLRKNMPELSVVIDDLNTFVPPKKYGAALLMESLCHVENQDKLLANLASNVEKLVIVDYCMNSPHPFFVPSWNIRLHDDEKLRKIIERAGFEIKQWSVITKDRWTPSLKYWKQKLETMDFLDGHLKKLYDYCDFVLSDVPKFRSLMHMVNIVAESKISKRSKM